MEPAQSSPPRQEALWSPAYLIEPQPPTRHGIWRYIDRLFHWWYTLTTTAQTSAGDHLRQRRNVRRGQLISCVLLFIICLIIILLPLALLNRDGVSSILLSVGLGICALALVANRRGLMVLASMLAVAVVMIVPLLHIILMPPKLVDLSDLNLLIFSELLSAAFLPTECIFLTAVLNCIIIIGIVELRSGGLRFIEFGGMTATGPAEVLIKLILLQIIVAVIVYLLVHRAKHAIMRADRAEIVATLEHAMAEREHAIAKQKRDLDLSIQQILQTHLEVANGNYEARVPLTQDNVLWPIAGSLNTILARLHRLQLQADELERTKQEAALLASALHATRMGEPPIAFRRSGTAIDLISFELNTQIHETI